MNRKGQTEVGMLIVIAMVAIIGAILMQASAQSVGDVINTVDVANESVSSVNGTVNGTLTQLSGKLVSDVVIYNATDIIVATGNYTIFNNQVVNGIETAVINVSAPPYLQPDNWNVSYTYQPTTYDASSGGRAVAGLIILFFALAIAIAMLVPTLRSKILDSIK